MSEKNIAQIIKNMSMHYSGLLKVDATNFGDDFMSKSIFNDIDQDKNNKLSEFEVSQVTQDKLESFIKKSLEIDDFYAHLYFGKEYSAAVANLDKNDNKNISEQIVEYNLKKVIEQIYQYAENHPEDVEIQKYSNKLKEIVKNNKLILTNIDDGGVSGRAIKNDDGSDTILLDNRDSLSNLNPLYLLPTLLHELRHALENDDINSKAEELEAELTARNLAGTISRQKGFYGSINDFLENYSLYAEASPGTYNIPKNTGVALWYKPQDVVRDGENLIIKSEPQLKLKNAIIEDRIVFGDKTDENGDKIPLKAIRTITDVNGKIIYKKDYGEYDSQKRKFNYNIIHFETKRIEMNLELKNNSFFKLG